MAEPIKDAPPKDVPHTSPEVQRVRAHRQVIASGQSRSSHAGALRDRFKSSGRFRAIAIGAAALASLLIGMNVVSGGSEDSDAVAAASELTPSVSPPVATASPIAGDIQSSAYWRSVLADIDKRRANAFQTLDVAALSAVDVPNSLAWQRDRDTIAQLQSSGTTAIGLSFAIQQLSVVDANETAAHLDVVDLRNGYEVRQAGVNATPSPVQSRGPLRWQISVQFVNGQWLISDVVNG